MIDSTEVLSSDQSLSQRDLYFLAEITVTEGYGEHVHPHIPAMFNISHYPLAGAVVAMYLHINNGGKESLLLGERDK